MHSRIISALAKIVLLHEDDNERIARSPVMQEVQHIRNDADQLQRELAAEREGRAFQAARIDAIIVEEAAAQKALKARAEKAERELAAMREAKERAEAALKDIADGPQPIEDYKFGIRCGLEDIDLQSSAYDAAEYGYEEGLDWCADIAARALKEPK